VHYWFPKPTSGAKHTTREGKDLGMFEPQQHAMGPPNALFCPKLPYTASPLGVEDLFGVSRVSIILRHHHFIPVGIAGKYCLA